MTRANDIFHSFLNFYFLIHLCSLIQLGVFPCAFWCPNYRQALYFFPGNSLNSFSGYRCCLL